jgi:uncharacterized membrane protein (DUF373 family)
MIPDYAVGFDGISDVVGCIVGILVIVREIIVDKKAKSSASKVSRTEAS